MMSLCREGITNKKNCFSNLSGDSGPTDAGLEPHLGALGLAGVHPHRLHLAAARTRSCVDAGLLQQVSPQHNQV